MGHSGHAHPLRLGRLIGLIPGAGDAATGFVSLYLVYEAARLGVGGGKLARMLLNILIDFVAGSIPIVGDLIDVGWKANRRNAKIIRDAVDDT